MATTQTYEILVKNSQALQSLNQIQQSVQRTSDSFSKFKSALTGAAILGTLKALGQTADAVKDLGEATGIATQTILGFQKAVSLTGGNAETAQKGILKLVSSIGQAAAGSGELQYAFSRVGVSLDDLRNLSEQDILRKTVAGLSGIVDPAQRAALVQQLLGKEFRNVNTSAEGLNAVLNSSIDKQDKNAAAVESMADAYQSFEQAMSAVKMGIMAAIKPLTDFINSMEPERLNAFAEGIGRIIVVFSAIWAYFKVVGLITALGEAMAVAGSIAGAVFGGGLAVALGWITAIIAALALVNEVLKFAFDIDIVKSLVEWVGIAYNKVKEFLGLKVNDTSAAHEKNAEATKKSGDATKAAGVAAREVVDPYKALREQIGGTADEFARMNKQNVDAINLATGLVGVSRQQAEITKATAEISKKAADEIQKLNDQKAKLTKEQQAAGLGDAIDKQIAKIQQQAEIDKVTTEQAIINSEKRTNARKLEEFAISSQIDLSNSLQKIQDDIAKSTMSEIERKYYDIDAAAKASAKSAIEAEEARRGIKLDPAEVKAYYDTALRGTEALKRASQAEYDNSRKFSTGWKKAFKEYADNATNAAKQAERIFSKFTQGLEDLIVNFVKTGKFEWKDFVNSMLEELLRSQIQQTIAGIMGGFSGGTGILGSIGSLFGLGGGGGGQGTQSNPLYVIDLSNGGGGFGGGGVIGGAGGIAQQGGGLVQSIKNLLGGSTNPNDPYGYGAGKDPLGDLISTLPGMQEEQSTSFWDSMTQGASDMWTSVTDTVGGWFNSDSGGGGILSSIGGLFDGWFANGGNIGAGKFGVVGENGPELVSGPASVTPMSGGTNVTYNINAVDAASFKAMIAQDPSFIYAVSMQGAKGIPSRR